MPLTITASLSFRADTPVHCLLQCEVAATGEQQIVSGITTLPAAMPVKRVSAQDALGERFWITAEGEIAVRYEAEVEIKREKVNLHTLNQAKMTDLPAEATQYLFDSRFCAGEQFQAFVHDEFGDLAGGARIAGLSDWIAEHFTYEPGTSGPHTTAADSFVARRGVCRDFTHVLIALARASGIPARYVSAYAPDVTPQDFHALAEVWLHAGDRQSEDGSTPNGGRWVLVDATGMAVPEETAAIGVGRDAADVSFLTSFGPVDFIGHTVEVTRG